MSKLISDKKKKIENPFGCDIELTKEELAILLDLDVVNGELVVKKKKSDLNDVRLEQ